MASKNNKNNKTFTITVQDYIVANRKGSRDAELEFSTGFVSKHKTHVSKKTYNRKNQKSLMY